MRILSTCLLLASAATLAGAQNSAPAAAKPAAGAPDSVAVDRIVAVVGDTPLTWFDVLEAINVRRASGLKVPPDSAGFMATARQVLNELVDEEVLVQKARVEKIEVADADLASTVDQQMKRVREQFKTDAELEAALKNEGFGTRDEYRRFLMDQARRRALQEKLVSKMRQEGKLINVGVSETDVTEAFDKNKGDLPKRPATVTFRQIIVTPRASAKAKAVAKAKAESLLVDLKKGADFALIAKRESMDSTSAVLGGDLGWNRRGVMLKEFENWMFALPPGQLSPVVETQYGYHIIKVDRAQPTEVKARHILIRPKIDSADVAAAKVRADSVLALWKAGTPFDTLVARYHDKDEDPGGLQPFPREQLPESYQKAFTGKGKDAYVEPFPIASQLPGVPKFVVAKILDAQDAGEYTVADLRHTIREQLTQERAYRRLIDQLRAATYVSIKL